MQNNFYRYFTQCNYVGGRRKEEGGRRKEEGGRRKEEGGRRKEEGGRRRIKETKVSACFSRAHVLFSLITFSLQPIHLSSYYKI